jgi:hypothetical protein
MPPQPVILESQNATSVADGATIERRIRISQPDEGRRRCKGSRAWDPRKDFSQPTQPPIQRPTPSDISKNAPSLQGVGDADMARSPSPRREPDMPAELLRALLGNVTKPRDGQDRLGCIFAQRRARLLPTVEIAMF